MGKHLLRMMGIVAVAGLLCPVLPVTVASSDHVSRCIRLCNAIRRACHERGMDICRVVFSGEGNEERLSACLEQAVAACSEGSRYCKESFRKAGACEEP